VTAALASPIPSLTSTSSQEATLVFQFGTTELLYASPTRCSTLGLYDIVCVPVSAIVPSNIATDTQITSSEHLQTLHARYPVLFPTVGSVLLCLGIESLDASKALETMFHGFTVSDLAAKDACEYAKVTTLWFSGCYSTDTSNIIVEFVACDDLQITDMLHSHLLDKFMASSNPPSTSNVRPQQGSKMSKPPWFQFIVLARSWSEKTLLIDGFMLESSPWHTLNLGFNPPHSPHKLQWFQFLQSAAHADESNRKEAVDLFLSNLYQTWHFTEILAAENYRVIISRQYKPNALVALILCKLLVTGYTFQLEGTYAQLDLKEGNLTHGHCQLLKYAIGFMALASQMASEIIQSDG
jgi:hypothetical protein